MTMNILNIVSGVGLSPTNADFIRYINPKHLYERPYIGGEFVESLGGRLRENITPITGMAVSNISDCTEQDVERAVKSAEDALQSVAWRTLGKVGRKELLLKLAKLIDEQANELAALDAIDVGKPFELARDIDIWSASDAFRWYGELIDKLEDRLAPTDNYDLLVREPIGVVGAILPWNYPMMILAWKVAPILAAGNAVIIKPAEQSPLSALRLAQLATECGFPPGVINVIPGEGGTVGKALGLHPRVRAIGFTGSTEVGKLIQTYSGRSNMKQVSLECGGKSPIIVLQDADPVEAAKAVASAIFYNGGQSCNAPTRALVHSSIATQFEDALVQFAGEYSPNNPFTAGVQVGAIISLKQLEKIDKAVRQAVADGGKILTGGAVLHLDSGGFYYAPTVITNTTNAMRINQIEVFGPILPIQTFETIAEAIEISNDTEYGLWANIWTNDLAAALELAGAIQAGTVALNCVWGGATSVPMGGYKQSGLGKELGLDGILKYTNLKHISLGQR